MLAALTGRHRAPSRDFQARPLLSRAARDNVTSSNGCDLMFINDGVMAPCSAAEREPLAELEDNARCTYGGAGRPPVHDFPPCAARLIERLRAEIVSLQIIAEKALTSAHPDSRHDGDAREHAVRLLREYFRAAFVGAGLAWRDTHNAGLGMLVDYLITAAGQELEYRNEHRVRGKERRETARC